MLKTPEYNRVYTAAQINIEALPQNQRTTNIIAKIVDEAIKFTRVKNFQYRDQKALIFIILTIANLGILKKNY